MAMETEHGHSHAHGAAHAHRRRHSAKGGRASPLAHGVGFRLAWAGGLAVLLWLAVFWALQ